MTLAFAFDASHFLHTPPVGASYLVSNVASPSIGFVVVRGFADLLENQLNHKKLEAGCQTSGKIMYIIYR